MTRKNSRASAFVESAADYTVNDGDDFRVTINAKDFPARGIFRVYRVYGDITKPERLKRAISSLLEQRGVPNRSVSVNL